MTKYIPPSFNGATVRDGLLKAMGFGEPNDAGDKVTFYFPAREDVSEPTDDAGVPFDFTVRPDEEGADPISPSCALQYFDAAEQPIDGGSEIKASYVVVTLLDEEWELVKEFSHLTAGGDQYNRDRVAPPVALGSIDVFSVRCRAVDER